MFIREISEAIRAPTALSQPEKSANEENYSFINSAQLNQYSLEEILFDRSIFLLHRYTLKWK